jgi:hypothetical protein
VAATVEGEVAAAHIGSWRRWKRPATVKTIPGKLGFLLGSERKRPPKPNRAGGVGVQEEVEQDRPTAAPESAGDGRNRRRLGFTEGRLGVGDRGAAARKFW